MTAEARLRELTDQLEHARRIASEKRRHYKAAQPLITTAGGYQAYLVAAAAYASAADQESELAEQFEEAMVEAQAEQIRRERERQPEFEIPA